MCKGTRSLFSTQSQDGSAEAARRAGKIEATRAGKNCGSGTDAKGQLKDRRRGEAGRLGQLPENQFQLGEESAHKSRRRQVNRAAERQQHRSSIRLARKK